MNLISSIHQHIAKRKLAKYVARQKAYMADYTLRRERALTPERRSHINALMGRSNG